MLLNAGRLVPGIECRPLRLWGSRPDQIVYALCHLTQGALFHQAAIFVIEQECEVRPCLLIPIRARFFHALPLSVMALSMLRAKESTNNPAEG